MTKVSDQRPSRIVAALGLSFALAGCKSAPEVAPVAPPDVSVSQPIERPVTEYYTTTGRTSAVDQVEIRSRVAGYLVNVNFADGAEVKAGSVLFEIDPRPYQAAVLRAQGDLAKWQAQLRKAEADVARNKRLFPKGAASEKDVESSVAAKDSAEAEIVSSKARLVDAKLDLEFSRVVAPVDGQLSRTAVTKGNLIQGGVSGSTLLTTLVSVDPLYVYLDADERALLVARERARGSRDGRIADARAVKIPIEIGLADEQGFSRRGVIDFIDNRVDPATGTIQIRGVFDNADRKMSPGMFVRARLPIDEMEKALLVTGRAIGTDQGNKYLLVVNEKNVVEYRPVVLGIESGELRVVSSGIKAGEWVITNGIQRVRPGVTVKPERTAMVASTEESSAAAPPAAGVAKD